MNQYVTGAVIKGLRERDCLTQAELADLLHVSGKTISKWETGKGYPDITLLEPLAEALRVSVAELLSGNAVCNRNISANMSHSCFYVCPVCGNVICSAGEASVSCHGITLSPLEAENADEGHQIFTEKIEDEFFVHLDHEMTRTHYISFLAAVSSDRVQILKLYPEWNAEGRFKISGVRKIYAFCNRDGLFCITPSVSFR